MYPLAVLLAVGYGRGATAAPLNPPCPGRTLATTMANVLGPAGHYRGPPGPARPNRSHRPGESVTRG